MKNKISEDLEFEKSKMEILKKINPSVLESKKISTNEEKPLSSHKDNKHAWEYEIEEYRKRKNNEKFFIFGALCGILSLIITIIFNYSRILEIFIN